MFLLSEPAGPALTPGGSAGALGELWPQKAVGPDHTPHSQLPFPRTHHTAGGAHLNSGTSPLEPSRAGRHSATELVSVALCPQVIIRAGLAHPLGLRCGLPASGPPPLRRQEPRLTTDWPPVVQQVVGLIPSPSVTFCPPEARQRLGTCPVMSVPTSSSMRDLRICRKCVFIY